MHHAGIISRRVYEASIASMVKGVKKYGPEPRIDAATNSAVEWGKDVLARNNINGVVGHWFPHIFSEAVDCANQTGLFADALGVDVLPEGVPMAKITPSRFLIRLRCRSVPARRGGVFMGLRSRRRLASICVDAQM